MIISLSVNQVVRVDVKYHRTEICGNFDPSHVQKFVSIGRMGTLFIKINYFISVKGLGLGIVSNSHTKGR